MRRNWGLALCTLVSAIALIKLLGQDVPGHYRVFTGAGRAFWESRNLYGDTFGNGIGYFFYSPACAMTFFGPLSYLPEKLGMVVYMVLSWAAFVAGARAFWRAVDARALPKVTESFWVVIAGQLWGGILASKIEILMTGLLLLACAWIAEGRRRVPAAILLAMLLNWKFQPLPTVGLLVLTLLIAERDWKTPLVIAGSLAGWYALPYLIRPSDYMTAIQKTYVETFTAFVADAWINFENLFVFLRHSFGIELSYRATQVISAAVGLALAGALSAYLVALRRRGGSPAGIRREGITLALALGAMFTVVFSPLGQNNSLILYAPLLLGAFLSFEGSTGRERAAWRAGLAATWLVMTVAYSDLIPHAWSEALRYVMIKPPACLLLGLAVLAGAWKGGPACLVPDRHPA